MFVDNPFLPVTELLSPLALQLYVILMVALVAAGTVYDVLHKRSAEFFTRRRSRTEAAAKTPLSPLARTILAIRTLGKEVATAGEFCNRDRRISHLLMAYGFVLYLVTTVILVFGYPTDPATPALVPLLWYLGVLMVLVGGYWFFFLLRVNVVHDGQPPWRLVRADLFIVTLLLSVSFALLFGLVQAFGHTPTTLVFFGLYILFSTALFGSVPWSKFAHMFYKPAAAFQRRVEEAGGASDLPAPAGRRRNGRKAACPPSRI